MTTVFEEAKACVTDMEEDSTEKTFALSLLAIAESINNLSETLAIIAKEDKDEDTK